MRRAPWRHRHTGGTARARRLLTAAGGAAVLALAAAACGQAGSAQGGSQARGIATYALPPGGSPNYIFPFYPTQYFTTANSDYLQMLLYRPLYWYGVGAQPTLNTTLSLAYPPQYAGQVVTIRLKPTYRWSNGERVNASDVLFWMHMMAAEKNNWGGFVPGAFPDNVTSVTTVGTDVVKMVIKGPYSQRWFTYNELSQITPLPRAWDVTAPGTSSDCTDIVADCKAVYNYLNSQAVNTASYGSSKIWSVVDGPWRLKSFDSQGVLTFSFNKSYSGPVAANHVTTFVELPFTSEQAEYNVLQAGSPQKIDVGYLPTVDAPVLPAGGAVGQNPVPGYSLSPLYAWGLNFFVYNFSNTTGQAAIFRQLYFRQAFQMLVNQAAIIQGPLHGYGVAAVGPVGSPPSTYLSPQERAKGDPFPYNPVEARQLLAGNGWAVRPGGVTSCARPGAGKGQCGAGIRGGQRLSFTLLYATGTDWTDSAVKQIQSDDAQVGIQLNLVPKTFSDVLNASAACTGNQHPKSCPWQLADWGGGWSYVPDYLPTGESLFQTGSLGNTGNYSDKANDTLIKATLRDSSLSLLYKWENYLTPKLPVVLQPNAPQSLIETAAGLHIGTQSPTLALNPEDWYWTTQ